MRVGISTQSALLYLLCCALCHATQCSDIECLPAAEGKAGSLVDDAGHFYKPLQVGDHLAMDSHHLLEPHLPCYQIAA